MKSLLTALSFVLFLSCSSSHSDDAAQNAGGVATSKKSDCLLRYAANYDQLLTKEDAAKILDRAAEEGVVKYNKAGKNTKYHEVVYTWKTDRIVNIQGFDVPDHDRISVTGIGEKSLQDFKRDYTRRTDEEIAALNQQIGEQLDKQFDEQSKDEKIETAKKKMNDLGVSNDAAKKTAKGISGTLSSSLNAYEDVAGLGDAAAWNIKDKNLYVLSNGVVFCVRINKGEDNELNKAVAMAAARLILGKCN